MRTKIVSIVVAAAVALGVGVIVGRATAPNDRPAALPSPGATSSVSPPAGTATPASPPITPDGTEPRSREISFSVRVARSIETDLPMGPVQGFTLRGASVDASGVDVEGAGRGTIRAEAGTGSVSVRGAQLSLAPSRTVLRAGGQPTLQLSGLDSLNLGTEARVTAERIFFVPDSGGPERELSSPVTIRASEPIKASAMGTDVVWTDAPARLVLKKSSRGSISWDGAGTIDLAGSRKTVAYGGVVATVLDVAVSRSSSGIAVTGTGRARQAYVDGAPQYSTKGTVDLINPTVTVPRGSRADLTWAPRNIGGDFDMCMTKISPQSPAARWVSLGLAPLPTMAGAATKRPRGGDTSGFVEGGPIRSVIPPGDADRRDLRFDVPSNASPGIYTVTIKIEGNFAPITVSFEIRVTQ